MSYNQSYSGGYGQGQGGYGQGQGGYGQGQGGYGQGQGNPFENNNYSYNNNDVEMGSYGRPQGGNLGGRNILDELSRINEGSDEIEKLLSRLEGAQRRALNDTTTDRNSPTVREVDSLNADIMAQYRNLLDKMKRVKQTPGAGSEINQKQIGVADRKLQGTKQRFMRLESDYQRRMREQTERQYRTAYPEASEEEVRTACEDPNQQVFAQALLNRDRRGESRQVLGAVRDRHEAIQKIERQIIELSELFNDMERAVVEQDQTIQQVEQSTIETNDNIVKANTELDTANKSAAAARKKKWICFWIVVCVIIIAAAVIAIAVAVTKNH